MSLDTLASLAQIATFVVIGATAVAGFIQLRHLRAAKQVDCMQKFFQTYAGPELRDAFRFVRFELEHCLKDPLFCEELRSGNIDLAKHRERQIANFFDIWGGYYRLGVIDRRAFMRQFAEIILEYWQLLAPVVALSVSRDGVNTRLEHFEYLTVQAQKWVSNHPRGDYPKDVPRIPLDDIRRSFEGLFPK